MFCLPVGCPSIAHFNLIVFGRLRMYGQSLAAGGNCESRNAGTRNGTRNGNTERK